MARAIYGFDIVAAINKLIIETTAECKMDAERKKAFDTLRREANNVTDNMMDYLLARNVYNTSKFVIFNPSGLRVKKLAIFCDLSESSESDESDESERFEVAHCCYYTISFQSYMEIVERLVEVLRIWLIELMEDTLKPIDFNAPIKRWTRKEKILFRAEIREISYEIRKKEVLEKMVELNQRRTSLGQTQETKLAVELIELLLQDIFLLRVIPFKDVVFPIHVKVYDWERVSKAIKGTHSPAECKEAWFSKFHPDLNRNAFSKAENRKLTQLAEHFNMYRWNEIAQRMETSRSGFQCFVQYRRYLYKNKPIVLNLSKQEEAKAEGQKKT